MAPQPTRDVSIILFDLKASARSSALHALSEVILYRQLSESKDQYKLYLVNAAQSSNALKYDGIYNLDAATNMGTLIEEILSIESGESSWLEAMVVATEELKPWFETLGVITLQILFITDMSSFSKETDNDINVLLDTLVNEIMEMDIFLYVIGPSVEPPKTICSHKDVEEWMSNLEVDKNNLNLKLMSDVVKRTKHSVMCNYNVGVHLFHSFKYCKGMQAWEVPLTLGTLFSMPVSTIRLTKREPPFRLKSTANRSYTGDKWAYEDQQDVTVDIHDTVNGLVKHGKFIKIESDGRFKVEGPRSFQGLGFTPAKNVPEYLLQSDGSYLVIPEKNQPEEYFKFFKALVEELANSDLYVLARRVYNKDFTPKFVVLIPRKDFNLHSFIMCELPYADDIAHVYKEQNISSAPRVDVEKVVFNYLDNINVSSDTCQIKVPLTPTMMVYSSALDIISKVEEKIIEERFLQRKVDTSDTAKELNLENLKNEWPVRQLEAIKKEEADLNDFDEVGDFNF